MSEKNIGKIDLKIGNISFSAEGEQNWLDEQLSKILEASKTPQLQVSAVQDTDDISNVPTKKSTTVSLASFIKEKGGDSNQVVRFLATSAWLFRKNGELLTTTLVAKALRDNHQKKLGNPADMLNQNCKKGHCEKSDDGFFITPEGWESLGESQ